MSEIIDVLTREILDSRGNPTVEVEVYLETGAPSRSDRVAKYNQLLRIEEELGGAGIMQAQVHFTFFHDNN